jgi:RecB family exonuclease
MSQVITQTERSDKTLLTYSALNTFRNCPRKYKNRYLDNLRPRERAEALSFGSVIHTAIELWYRSSNTESRLHDVLAYIDDAFENRVVDQI